MADKSVLEGNMLIDLVRISKFDVEAKKVERLELKDLEEGNGGSCITVHDQHASEVLLVTD
jgi:hypothetical protein